MGSCVEDIQCGQGTCFAGECACFLLVDGDYCQNVYMNVPGFPEFFWTFVAITILVFAIESVLSLLLMIRILQVDKRWSLFCGIVALFFSGSFLRFIYFCIDPYQVHGLVPTIPDSIMWDFSLILYLLAVYVLVVHFAVIVQSSQLGLSLEIFSNRIRILMSIVSVVITLTLVPLGILHALLNSELVGVIYHLMIAFYIFILVPSCLWFGFKLRKTLRGFHGISAVRKRFLVSLDRFMLLLNFALTVLILDTIAFTFTPKTPFAYIGYHWSFKMFEALAGVSMLLFTWKSKVQAHVESTEMKARVSDNIDQTNSKSNMLGDISRGVHGPTGGEGRGINSKELNDKQSTSEMENAEI